jgi:hypothetical protein
MHRPAAVVRVLELRGEGLGARRIARLTGLPVRTVTDWLAGKLPHHSRVGSTGKSTEACDQCGHEAHRFSQLPASYTYLLGLYLGDGCISSGPRGVYRLRITLDLAHPKIVDECEVAMREVAPRNRVHRLLRKGSYVDQPEPTLVEVSAYSKSWPCLFPQHGPGVKHTRPIRLTEWQRQLVHQHPKLLLRGLIHSDGCRFTNTGRGGWVCPRYTFCNVSDDIKRIFCDTCELLGLHWTKAGQKTIYVSRKADVQRLDEFIGPKA